ncbi:MAG: hypothetical protein EOL97_14410 [Spirochaetia bacterium]|nr:hypothetical protein [Spirochaetia bacterium]
MDEKRESFFWKRAGSPVYLKKFYPRLLEGDVAIPELSRDVNMTFSYLCQILNELEKDFFIIKVKHKNTNIIKLTKKGLLLSKLSLLLTKVVDNYNEKDDMGKIISKLFEDEINGK